MEAMPFIYHLLGFDCNLVLGSVQAKKWRFQRYGIKYFSKSFLFCHKANRYNVLRFHPIQIAEWLTDLLGSGMAHSQAELEVELGVDRTRIGQFLRLMRLPAATRTRLRNERDLNEFRLRRLVGERTVLAVGEE